MVNLIEFTLRSDGGERFLFISPVLMQSKEKPSLLPPIKVYVYENLIKEEFWAHLGDKKNEIPKEFERKGLVIKHGQNFEKAYLGYLTLNSAENTRWQWEGNLKRLNKGDIEKIEAFLNSYKNNKIKLLAVARLQSSDHYYPASGRSCKTASVDGDNLFMNKIKYKGF